MSIYGAETWTILQADVSIYDFETWTILQPDVSIYGSETWTILQPDVSIYGSETWTILQANAKQLEAFHVRCQRRIIGLGWQDLVSNEEARIRNLLNGTIQKQRVKKLLAGSSSRVKDVSANQTLWIEVDVLHVVVVMVVPETPGCNKLPLTRESV